MKITTITFERLTVTKRYENKRISVTAELGLGDSATTVLETLEEWLDKEIHEGAKRDKNRDQNRLLNEQFLLRQEQIEKYRRDIKENEKEQFAITNWKENGMEEEFSTSRGDLFTEEDANTAIDELMASQVKLRNRLERLEKQQAGERVGKEA